MLIDPPPDIERKPQSEFFTARIIDRGELSWLEIRALASIGAGLLMRHLGDRRRSTNWPDWPYRLMAFATTKRQRQW